VSTPTPNPPRRRPTTKRRSTLRFETLNGFVDEGMRHLTPFESAVWLVLYRDTKPDGIARTAVDDIAERAGMGRRTVLRSLKSLEVKRMVRVVRRGGLNRGPSTYRVFPYPAPHDWD
jgi:DNA-binding MarR family transcriptional regulator